MGDWITTRWASWLAVLLAFAFFGVLVPLVVEATLPGYYPPLPPVTTTTTIPPSPPDDEPAATRLSKPPIDSFPVPVPSVDSTPVPVPSPPYE